MDRAELLYLLCENAGNLYTATLIHPRPPSTERIYEAVKDPKPGQLAYENTGLFQAVRLMDSGDFAGALANLEMRIGRIAKICREPIMTEEEFVRDGYAPDERPTEHVVYLDALSGKQVRWTNCNFIRILETSTFRLGEESRKAVLPKE